MKKTMTVIALFAVLLITVSAHSGRVYEAAEGYKAPAITLCKSDSTLSLADLKGRYVLLTFWASSDAESRVTAGNYNSFAEKAEEEQFCLVSVNMDCNETLYNEIVRRDNLNAKSQFQVKGEDVSTVKEKYHLENGFNSYLIDPTGQIIATNPSEMTLTQVLGNN